MATRIVMFDVLTPAGTLSTAPLTTPLKFIDAVVTELEIVVPDGHSGLTGLKMAYGGAVIIPDEGTAFLVTNDETIHWPLLNYPTGGQWQAVTFNGDVYDHTFYLRFLLDELPSPASFAQPQPVIVP